MSRGYSCGDIDSPYELLEYFPDSADPAERRLPSERVRSVTWTAGNEEVFLRYAEKGHQSGLESLLRLCADFSSQEKQELLTTYSESGLTALHYCAANTNAELLQTIVTFCADETEAINVKSKDADERTALHIAVINNQTQHVQILLSHPHIRLNEADAHGLTPVHYACQKKLAKCFFFMATSKHRETAFCVLRLLLVESPEFVQYFKDMFASDPYSLACQDSHGNTLLHIAGDAGEEEIVDNCLEVGFDPAKKNSSHYSPLHAAARKGHVKIAEKLIEKAKLLGWDGTTFINLHGQVGRTPLYLASVFGQPEMIDFLLKMGADVEAKTENGNTPLTGAIRHGNPECVELLLARNASILTRDSCIGLNALLWAINRQDAGLVEMILNHAREDPMSWTALWKSKDFKGNSALHIAAGKESLDVLKVLVQNDTTHLGERNEDGYTPFHEAIRKGRLDNMNYLFSKSAETAFALDDSQNSGLHLAAKRGNFVMVEKLVIDQDFVNFISHRNSDGRTPIHLAAMNGHHALLTFLLEQRLGDREQKKRTLETLDHKHASALYLACQMGYTECIEVMLRYEALVMYSCSTEGTVPEQMFSCLNAAIDGGHSCAAIAIVKSPAWKKALQFCSKEVPGEFEGTPLRKLIKKMPEVAKLVLDQCVDGGEYNFEFVEDFQNLRPKVGTEDTSKVYGMVQLLRASTRRKRPRASAPTTVETSILAPEARETSDKDTWGPPRYSYQNHPVRLMLHYRREELLNHPVVSTFLDFKWQLARYPFYLNLVLYLLFMLLLNGYLFLRFAYSKKVARELNSTLGECISVPSSVLQDHQDLRRAVIVFATLLILGCIAKAAQKVIFFVIFIKRHDLSWYVGSYVNYLRAFFYTLSFLLAVTGYTNTDCLPNWQWQCGALSIFLSWMNLILRLSPHPSFGLYVLMMENIISTYICIGPLLVLLVIGFSLPFFMLFSLIPVVANPFVNVGFSLLKTLIMTTGEFGIEPLLFSQPLTLDYPSMTYLIWIIFLFVMPILLYNLLVGLAVNDIKSIQDQANLRRKSLQVKFILRNMTYMPTYFLHKWNQTIYRPKPSSIWKRKLYKLVKHQATTDESSGSTSSHEVRQLKQEVTNLAKSMSPLRQQILDVGARQSSLMLHQDDIAQKQEQLRTLAMQQQESYQQLNVLVQQQQEILRELLRISSR